jgi:Spy/CpxP family protein refolding chaperone
MKASVLKRIAAASLGVLLSLSAASWSMHHRGGMEQDPGRMLSHMAERLELTDQQRTRVQTLVDAGREESTADRARLEELRGQLMAMRDNFDPGEAQKIADEIGEITSRMVYRFSSSFAEFYGLLTDEQKAGLEKLQAERGERRQKKFRENRD